MRLLLYFLLLGAGYVPAACRRAAAPLPQTAPTFPVTTAVATWPPLIQVPFVLTNNLPVVQATVDGRTGNFILDTGAEATLLNQRYFPGGPAATSVGAGATGTFQQTSACRVSRFGWQGLTMQDVHLTTTDLDHLGAAPLLGLLGADLLAHYAVTLDYAARMAILRATAACPAARHPPACPAWASARYSGNHCKPIL